MKKMAQKSKKKSQTIEPEEDLDLDSMDTLDDLNSDTVATTQEASGLNVMDTTEFEEGIEDITEESEGHIKGLVYGRNGTGKTRFGSTLPGPRLFLDVNDRGTKSAVGTVESCKRSIDTFDLFQMAYWYLKGGNHQFASVIIDHLSNLQKLMLNWIMKKESNWDPLKDMDMPNKRDYGGLSQLMQRWILDFRNLPMNVLFIAQENSSDDDDVDSDIPTVFPQVTRSVRGIIGGAVDFIGHTYVRESIVTKDGKEIKSTKFCMRLGPNSKYTTKIRLPVGCPKPAPAAIVNPTYDAVQKIMRGEF
jgi:hypothetical protein